MQSILIEKPNQLYIKYINSVINIFAGHSYPSRKSADTMFFYAASLTFVLDIAFSMHVAVQHSEHFENGLEMDRAIDPKGYRLENLDMMLYALYYTDEKYDLQKYKVNSLQ